MARKQQSRGKCGFCGKEMTRGGMLKHLATCAARQHAIGEADGGRGVIEPIYHLQVRDAWGGDYWLNLEMPGSANTEGSGQLSACHLAGVLRTHEQFRFHASGPEIFP